MSTNNGGVAPVLINSRWVLDESRREDLRSTVEDDRAMPFWSYTDPGFHQFEMQQVFHSDWVFACFAEEVSEPGDFYSVSLGGEPVVVSRTQEGGLQALSNVCRHRGAVLVEGSGNTKRFSCPYHGWTYREDGTLLSVPFEGDTPVDKDAHCLPSFRIEEWNELIFVSLNPDVEPLSERYAGIAKHLGTDFFPGYKRNREARKDNYPMDVNWKIVMENACDAYHLFKAHAKTLEPTTPTRTAFFIDGTEHWTLSGIGESAKALHGNGGVGEVGVIDHSSIIWLLLPPSFALVISTDWVGWQAVDPVSVDRTEQSFGQATHPDVNPLRMTRDERRFYANVGKAYKEDMALFASVQKGSSARRSRPGRLVSPMENATKVLHKHIARAILQDAPGESSNEDT